MKLYILSILSLGSVFANQSNEREYLQASNILMQEKRIQETSLDPTRAVRSVSIEGGPIMVVSIYGERIGYTGWGDGWQDVNLSIRTPIIISKDGKSGFGHKLSFGLCPGINIPSLVIGVRILIHPKPSPYALFFLYCACNFSYEYQVFFNPNKNQSSYIGVGPFCRVTRSFFGQYFLLPGFSLSCGKEYNRKGNYPTFMEAGVNLGKNIDYICGAHSGILIYPNIKCGFNF